MGAMLQPEFLTGSKGRLFTTCYEPTQGTDSWLLFLPPYAEEMNKSRRMMSRLGHALANEGMGMCLPDYYGTGDSGGDFADADITVWQQDIQLVIDWLRQQHGCRRLVIGGLRFGALLAMQLRQILSEATPCLLWQPAQNGRQLLTQFLRLRLAGALTGNQSRETTQSLLDHLGQGRSLEIAGYELSPAMAGGLLSLQLLPPRTADSAPVAWFEVSGRSEPELLPVSRSTIDTWQADGVSLTAAAVTGDSFWQTQELVDAPALIAASLDTLRDWQWL